MTSKLQSALLGMKHGFTTSESKINVQIQCRRKSSTSQIQCRRKSSTSQIQCRTKSSTSQIQYQTKNSTSQIQCRTKSSTSASVTKQKENYNQRKLKKWSDKDLNAEPVPEELHGHVYRNYRLSKAAKSDVQKLLNILEYEASDFNAVNLATIMHRLARLRTTSNTSGPFVKSFSPNISSKEKNRSEHEVSRNDFDRVAMLALDAASAHPEDFSAIELSSMMYSLGLIGPTLQGPFTALRDTLASLATRKITHFSPVELVNLIWGYSRARGEDADGWSVFINEMTLRDLTMFDNESLSSFLYSIGFAAQGMYRSTVKVDVIEGTFQSMDLDPEFHTSMHIPPSVKHEPAKLCLQTFSTVKTMDLLSKIVQTCLNRFNQDKNSISPRSIASIAYGCINVGYTTDPNLLQLCLSVVDNHIASSANRLDITNIINVVWGIARISSRSPTSLQKNIQRVLNNVANSLVLHWSPKRNDTLRTVYSIDKQTSHGLLTSAMQIRSTPPPMLVKLLWSFARCSVHIPNVTRAVATQLTYQTTTKSSPLDRLDAALFATSCWAIASSGVHVPMFWSAVCRRISHDDTVYSFDANSAALVLWALSTAKPQLAQYQPNLSHSHDFAKKSLSEIYSKGRFDKSTLSVRGDDEKDRFGIENQVNNHDDMSHDQFDRYIASMQAKLLRIVSHSRNELDHQSIPKLVSALVRQDHPKVSNRDGVYPRKRLLQDIAIRATQHVHGMSPSALLEVATAYHQAYLGDARTIKLFNAIATSLLQRWEVQISDKHIHNAESLVQEKHDRYHESSISSDSPNNIAKNLISRFWSLPNDKVWDKTDQPSSKETSVRSNMIRHQTKLDPTTVQTYHRDQVLPRHIVSATKIFAAAGQASARPAQELFQLAHHLVAYACQQPLSKSDDLDNEDKSTQNLAPWDLASYLWAVAVSGNWGNGISAFTAFARLGELAVTLDMPSHNRNKTYKPNTDTLSEHSTMIQQFELMLRNPSSLCQLHLACITAEALPTVNKKQDKDSYEEYIKLSQGLDSPAQLIPTWLRKTLATHYTDAGRQCSDLVHLIPDLLRQNNFFSPFTQFNERDLRIPIDIAWCGIPGEQNNSELKVALYLDSRHRYIAHRYKQPYSKRSNRYRNSDTYASRNNALLTRSGESQSLWSSAALRAAEDDAKDPRIMPHTKSTLANVNQLQLPQYEGHVTHRSNTSSDLTKTTDTNDNLTASSNSLTLRDDSHVHEHGVSSKRGDQYSSTNTRTSKTDTHPLLYTDMTNTRTRHSFDNQIRADTNVFHTSSDESEDDGSGWSSGTESYSSDDSDNEGVNNQFRAPPRRLLPLYMKERQILEANGWKVVSIGYFEVAQRLKRYRAQSSRDSQTLSDSQRGDLETVLLDLLCEKLPSELQRYNRYGRGI